MPKQAAKKGKAPNDFLKRARMNSGRCLSRRRAGTRKPAKRSRVCHATAHTKKGETRQAFIERFMKSNAAKEFPTQKQRLAVAYQQYRGKKK